MAEITIANVEWEILEDVQQAIAAATISTVKVFDSATVCVSQNAAEDALYVEQNVCVVLCNEISEAHAVGLERQGSVSISILVAYKGDSNEDRIENILRLIAAVRNAVEETPPANARAVSSEEQFGEFRERLEWGEIELSDDRDPWIIGTIPLVVNFQVSSRTSH